MRIEIWGWQGRGVSLVCCFISSCFISSSGSISLSHIRRFFSSYTTKSTSWARGLTYITIIKSITMGVAWVIRDILLIENLWDEKIAVWTTPGLQRRWERPTQASGVQVGWGCSELKRSSQSHMAGGWG